MPEWHGLCIILIASWNTFLSYSSSHFARFTPAWSLSASISRTERLVLRCAMPDRKSVLQGEAADHPGMNSVVSVGRLSLRYMAGFARISEDGGVFRDLHPGCLTG